jgi:ABC-type multidrug transport system fused ATPase/permease subunit
MLFQNSAKSIATIVIISVATPPFVALVIPLGCLYLYIQRYYLRTSRELKRLDSVSRSPIYAHFQESLGGISTIRAYQQQSRFINENEWRVDANLRAYFPSINANRCVFHFLARYCEYFNHSLFVDGWLYAWSLSDQLLFLGLQALPSLRLQVEATFRREWLDLPYPMPCR